MNLVLEKAGEMKAADGHSRYAYWCVRACTTVILTRDDSGIYVSGSGDTGRPLFYVAIKKQVTAPEFARVVVIEGHKVSYYE